MLSVPLSLGNSPSQSIFLYPPSTLIRVQTMPVLRWDIRVYLDSIPGRREFVTATPPLGCENRALMQREERSGRGDG